MVKEIVRRCDRCNQQIKTSDERLQDSIDQDFPGKDICPACAGEIDLAGVVARRAALEGRSPKDVLADWLKLYD